MRIISGKWRGRNLVAPAGDATRPTAERTRETLFSMLVSRLGSFEDLRVADLFAGSGALGLEALSRGAAKALFVEQDPAAIRAIRSNIANLQAAPQCEVRAASVMTLGAAPKQTGGPAPKTGDRAAYDLIFLDPPYGTGAGGVALDKLLRLGWIDEATWISLETGVKDDVKVRGLTVEATRKVGKAQITLLRMAPTTE